jgi:hypothetical protein
MSDDIFAEKLSWVKQHEKPEVVLLIANNPEFVKLVIAWTNIEVKRSDELTKLIGESENEIWKWLWENICYSRKDFNEKLDIPFSEPGLEYMLKPLVGNRIIYPDGTVNSYVNRYLKEQVVKLFENKPNKSTKRTG